MIPQRRILHLFHARRHRAQPDARRVSSFLYSPCAIAAVLTRDVVFGTLSSGR